MTNHNVETCRKKKEQTTVATIKAAQPSQKPYKTSSYACHIYGLHGYKMTYCPKFIKMQKMFHGKFVTIPKVQLVVEAQIVTIDVNVVEVTRDKCIPLGIKDDNVPPKFVLPVENTTLKDHNSYKSGLKNIEL